MSNFSGGSRPVVLAFARYYLPGYKAGGPIRTISNMVEVLGDELNFRIVTSDRDATDAIPYEELEGRCGWQDVGKAKVLYLAPSQKTISNITQVLRQTPHDTLYLNSFFDPDFTLKPLLSRRFGLVSRGQCVIAPRGEFSKGALGLKSQKKKAFLAVSKAIGLYHNLVWQASSQHELQDIKTSMGIIAADIRVAPNLSAPIEQQVKLPQLLRKVGEPLRIVFLSRISPMKNLDYALEVLQQVGVPVHFDIYGEINDKVYWVECQKKMKQMPSHIHVTYKGAIPHYKVSSTLAEYDLFFLPTKGENFGHAIFEALSIGTPVLISNTTPWRELAEKGIGWELPLQNKTAFAEMIEFMCSLKPHEHVLLREKSLSFAANHSMDLDAWKANHKLFTPPMSQGG